MVITGLFIYLHVVLNNPRERAQEQIFLSKSVENTLLLYCFSCSLREIIEASIESTLYEFLTDGWTIVDILQIGSFMYGIALRGGEAGFPQWEEGLEYGNYLSGITWWKFWYGVSLFFLSIRCLRVLSIVSEEMSLLVIILGTMLHEVRNWSFIYLVATVAFSVLLYGSGDHRGALDNCHVLNVKTYNSKPKADTLPSSAASGYMFSECLPQWWFFRTVLQGFGELFIEDMNNVLSVLIVTAAFIVLNVILLNLLIAMMAGTFEKLSQQAKRQGMIQQFDRISEFRRKALGSPPFVNVFAILWDFCFFIVYYGQLKRKYIGCPFHKLLDIYLSRNVEDIHEPLVENSDDRRSLELLRSFMEEARAKTLDDSNEDGQILQLQRQLGMVQEKIEAQVQHLGDVFERKSDKLLMRINRWSNHKELKEPRISLQR
jgi:hypothetical protein